MNRQEIEQLTQHSSIPQLQAQMQNQTLTALALTQHYLAKIEQRNPKLNAIIAITPQAEATAQALDEERTTNGPRGPLHGIPILIKDNIETVELPTTAGSLALAHNYTRRDAPVVAKLRAAGAIILGKTNLSEWANFRSFRSSSGWSAVGGQCRNPHDSTRSPCGSSSGSGAAVAANLAVTALGTETNGSVVCPANVNGVVGVKPTVGLVSRTGIVPISHTQDTAGPMTKCVVDAAILLAVMAGVDPADPSTAAAVTHIESTYRPEANGNLLTSKRIGILRATMGKHEGVDAVFEEALTLLAHQGATLVEIPAKAWDQPAKFWADCHDVLSYQFKHTLNEYLAALPNDCNQLTLEKLIQFNLEHRDEEMHYFGQEEFERAEAKGPLTEQAYLDTLAYITEATQANGIDKFMDEYELDAISAPTASAAWTIDLINGDKHLGGCSTLPAVAGYPHVTVPMGKLHHLPVGISFMGPAFADKALIALAAGFESAMQVANA